MPFQYTILTLSIINKLTAAEHVKVRKKMGVMAMKDTEIYELVLEEIKAMRKKLDNVEEVLNTGMQKAAPHKGVKMYTLIDLEPTEKRAVLELMKSGKLTLTSLAKGMKMSPEDVQLIARDLVEKGYLKSTMEQGEDVFEVSLARKRTSKLPFNIWGSLEKKLE